MSKTNSNSSVRRSRPALTPESRESQLISLAVDCAEKQLKEGTASSQVITHYLKLGSTKAELEKQKLEHENKLLQAKTEAIQSAKRMDEMYEKAINAMMNYQGRSTDDEEEYEDY